MVSDIPGLDARTPDQELRMGASVEDDPTREALLPPNAASQFNASLDDLWMTLRRGQTPPIQAGLQQFFSFIGRKVTMAPGWTIFTCMALTTFCMLGLIGMRIETDPIKLWVPETSRAAQDKVSYDAEFGPFYRIEQIILSTKPGVDGARPSILSMESMKLVSVRLGLHSLHSAFLNFDFFACYILNTIV